jgi:glutathione S-transferase
MVNPPYRLVIGTKAWSSWSLRPWILMRQLQIPFDEVEIALRTPDTARDISRYSPSDKVPVLVHGDVTVWDSLAIVEYLADRHPELPVWPADAAARAVARSVSAEMHAGFAALRQNCPMDFNARGLSPADAGAIPSDVRRIVGLWSDCRRRFGGAGPFLFGQFSAADAMYAPVVSRFTSYDINLPAHGDDGTAKAYMAAVSGLPAWAEWAANKAPA